MKKVLIISAVAALALVSCAKVQDVYTPEAQEIAFQAVTSPTTKDAVDGATFPTTLPMMVTAYNATASRVYFDATAFNYSGASNIWAGATKRYWPFTPATINFLAIANANADNAAGVTWGTYKADQVEIVMSDNSTAQRDLMYACGTGTVTQTGTPANTLNFPVSVPMEFKHAQAWVKFYVQAANEASEAITINSITLNSVSCQGTYTVTHTNYNATSSQSVAGIWTAYNTYAGNTAAVVDGGYSGLDYDAATLPQYYGSLMVVPNQGMTGFTINYTLDGNTYEYTYTPASTALAQATKYTYNITLTVHEILVAATVDDWDEGGPTAVTLG